METTFPRVERGPAIEVSRLTRGRPSYRWVLGWQIRHSETRVTTPMRRAEALAVFRELRAKERARPCVTVRRDRETGRPVLFFYNANTRGYWLECYDRIGQHSEATRDYMKACKRCAPSDDDAAALVREWDTLGGFIGTGKARRVAALRPPVGLAYIGD